MLRCLICDSEILFWKKYGDHIPCFDVASMVKKALPHVDFLIPGFFPSLKRLSRRKPLYKGATFRGYINICTRCGHGVMKNPPTAEALSSYYQRHYWSHRSAVVTKSTIDEHEYQTNPRARHQIDLVMKLMNGGQITDMLEIGAGAGYASLLLRDRLQVPPVHLYACEAGHQWDDYYQRNGIERIADFFPFRTTQKFDYIHAGHWLEHTIDLDKTLSSMNEILLPSGHVFIEVPNTAHYYWGLPLEDVPHIHFFTPESLVKAFEKHRFECIHIGEYGITFLERQKGVKVTEDRYGSCEKGFWIRALFKKM